MAFLKRLSIIRIGHRGTMNETAKKAMNETAKRTMNETARTTMNEIAKRMNEIAKNSERGRKTAMSS